MKRECVHMQEMIQRQLDGDMLAEQDAARLAAHLLTCATCRPFARDLQRVAGLVQRLPLEPAPAGLAARIVQQAFVRQAAPAPQAAWQQRVARVWAPVAGVAGLLLLMYQAIALHGVSLANLPSALVEWATLVDLNDLGSLFQATSLFASNIGVELVLGVSLVIVAAFALMAQAMARPPAMCIPARRSG